MNKPYARILALMTGVMLIIVLSACSTPSGSVAPKTKSAQQVLLDSLAAMKQLKAVHVDLNGTTDVTTAGSSATTQGTTVHVKLSGNGDEVLPDENSMRLTVDVNLGNTSMSLPLGEIIVGKQLYLQSPKGQWYLIDSAALGSNGSINPFAGTDPSTYNRLLTLAQKATITDHGMQTLDGQSLRHISVLFGKDALKDLLDATGQAGNLSANQQALLNQVKLDKPTLDLWIDPATSYIHRLQLKFTLDMHMSGLATSTPTTSFAPPSDVSVGLDMTINFSKFNESVKITAPANAIPASNLLQILQ